MIGGVVVVKVANAGDVDGAVALGAGLVLGLVLRLERAVLLLAAGHDDVVRDGGLLVRALRPVLDLSGCHGVLP